MKRGIGYLFFLLGVILGLHAPAFGADKKPLSEILYEKGMLTKEEAASAQETALQKFVQRVTFSSDLRIRHESFWYSADPGTGEDTKNRHRQRFRLRLGANVKLQNFLVVVRLASGTGEAVSTNQSMDNLFTQKGIWIDQAYVAFNSPSASWLTLAAGRMQNPFVRFYSSDIVWDDDVNPEGFAQQLKFNAGDSVIFVNLAEMVMDEDAGTGHDQWLMGGQVGTNFAAGDLKATVAGAFYEVLNATTGTFSQAPVQDGNTRVAGVLVNRFHILNLTTALNTKIGDLPLAIMGDYVRNLADTTNGAGVATGNVGYQLGAIVGKASDPNTWELAYFYKMVETDATLADLSDSDFGVGGIDRRGHITWVAYSPTKFFQAKAKVFVTETNGESIPGLKDDITRLQVDFVTKF